MLSHTRRIKRQVASLITLSSLLNENSYIPTAVSGVFEVAAARAWSRIATRSHSLNSKDRRPGPSRRSVSKSTPPTRSDPTLPFNAVSHAPTLPERLHRGACLTPISQREMKNDDEHPAQLPRIPKEGHDHVIESNSLFGHHSQTLLQESFFQSETFHKESKRESETHPYAESRDIHPLPDLTETPCVADTISVDKPYSLNDRDVDLFIEEDNKPDGINEDCYWSNAAVLQLQAPQTPFQLMNELVSMNKRAGKLVPFSQLLKFHQAQPCRLRTTGSYNLLLQFAIRHAKFGLVPKIFAQMGSESFEPDLETWKLRIRWMVLSGRWENAWNVAIREFCPPDSQDPLQSQLPTEIWIELCRQRKRGAFRGTLQTITDKQRRTYISGERHPAKVIPRHVPGIDTSPETRLYKMMQHFPSTMTPEALSKTSARAILALTHLMRQCGKPETAFAISKTYLGTLPTDLDAGSLAIAQDLIESHVRYCHTAEMDNFRKREGSQMPWKGRQFDPKSSKRGKTSAHVALDGFLAIHPGVIVSPVTVNYVLLGAPSATYALQFLRDCLVIFSGRSSAWLSDAAIHIVADLIVDDHVTASATLEPLYIAEALLKERARQDLECHENPAGSQRRRLPMHWPRAFTYQRRHPAISDLGRVCVKEYFIDIMKSK